MLGAPLFAVRVLDEAWASRCSELSGAADRLQLTCAQDALILLRASFSAPRVQHLMRCFSSVDNRALADFDKLLRSTISHLSNCDLTEVQWLQASLPVKMGGLGVRTVSSLALHAYLALVGSTPPSRKPSLMRPHALRQSLTLPPQLVDMVRSLN